MRNTPSHFFPALLVLMLTSATSAESIKNLTILPAVNVLLGGQTCPEGYVELAGNGIDDDCDYLVDEPPEACDIGIPLDEPDPIKAAAAMDICKTGSDTEWGLLSASFERANGESVSPTVQHGVLSSFGNNTPPRNGNRILYLSTGTARLDGNPGACNDESCAGFGSGTAPIGFPQRYQNCPVPTSIHDDIALEISMRAPPNVSGFEFSFIFSTFGFPEGACNSFVDQFIVQMVPAPLGAINGNISFDTLTTPASANWWLDHCDPDSYPGLEPWETSPSWYCSKGDSIMDGTGFNEWTTNYAGSSGWMTTRAPVTPESEFTLRFLIWDSDDQTVDSSVVIDNFRWIGGTPFVSTGPDP